MKPRPRSTSSRQATTSAAMGSSAKSRAVRSSTFLAARRCAASAASNAAKCAPVSVNEKASGAEKSFGFHALRARTGTLFVTMLILVSPSGEVLLEEGDRPLPGQLGRRLVVARRRVVVKAMLGAGVHVHLVLGAARLQRRLEGRPRRVDALVALGVLDQQRRLDGRHSRRLGRYAVEWDARFQICAECDRQEVGCTA